jgi:hypothetical protein
MTVRDDFREWERELREHAPERSRPWGVMITVLLLSAGCVGVIALGEIALGVCAFVICALILVLWYAGM